MVKVNGTVCKIPEDKFDGETDHIQVNGQTVCFKKHLYIMMNKPSGLLSASNDKKAKTVIDILPKELQRNGLFPAGRLDKDTEGLLIITDDGDFAHKMLHPKKKVYKLYYAEIDQNATEEDVKAFKQGIVLEDGTKCLPAELTVVKDEKCPKIYVKICEGKFHQVKKMVKSRGKTINYLKRISIGALKLDENLVQGGCRELTETERNLVFISNIN